MTTTDTGPQTEAGRALVEWAENAAPEQIDIWRDHAMQIEVQARRLDEPELTLEDRIDGHVVAAWLHPILWGNRRHEEEPDDGDDCGECYGQAGALIRRILQADEQEARLAQEETRA